MQTLLTVVHIVVCVFLILVVLLQAGKGGGMGIAFGGAGSQTVFGSSGAGNFLTRLTTVTAAVFMLSSLGLAHFSSVQDSRKLQEIAEKKATQKKDDEVRNAQVKTDIEKAREAIEKSTGLKMDPAKSGEGAPAAPGVPGTPGSAEEAAKAIQNQIEKELGAGGKKLDLRKEPSTGKNVPKQDQADTKKAGEPAKAAKKPHDSAVEVRAADKKSDEPAPPSPAPAGEPKSR